MALSRQVILSDGVTKQYPISFSDGYLSRNEVKVYEEFNDGTPSDPIAFTWINDALIELERVPVIGSKIIIERNVDAARRKVNFIPEYIKSSDLNVMYKHLLYLCQAVVDGRFEAALVKDLNMGFNRIYNLGAPVQDNDAVRLVDVKDYTDLAKELIIQANASKDASKVSEDNAKQSEIKAAASAKFAEDTVNGFDQRVEDSKLSIDQFTGMKIDDIDSHAAVKEQEYNANAAEKQQQVDASANNANVSELKAKASELNSKESERRAKIWAEGTVSEVTSIGGTLSSKDWAKRAEEIVGKGVINDDLVSMSTTYSSDKLEKHFAVNEDHDSVLDCLDVLETEIGAKTVVPLSSLLAIDSDARPSHKAKGAEVYDEFGTFGIIDSITSNGAVIITKESREKVRVVDTLDIQKNGLDQYYVALTANEIRNEINKGKIVQLRFDDVITNTGEQLYPFETFDKENYAVFRRNVVTADKAERINIKVDYQGIVTFDTVTLKVNGSIDQNTGNPLYDWVGTTAEYEAQDVANLHPDWLCYITDDVISENYATKADLESKANTNADNFTSVGKSNISSLGMPSEKYIDLTAGASGSTYTAPANGWVYVYGFCTSGSHFITLVSKVASEIHRGYENNHNIATYIPVLKNDTITLFYNLNKIEQFRFIYAEGGK